MTTTSADDEKKARAAARIGAMLRGETQPKTAGDGAAHRDRETPWNPNSDA